jgi:hypothetical protein
MTQKTIKITELIKALVTLFREHRVIAETGAIIASIFLTFIGWWQLDLISFPEVWGDVHIAEILPFWFMKNTDAYVMFFGWIFVGYAILLALYFLKGKEIKELKAEGERR